MIYSIKTNLKPLLSNLIEALQPFANANDVALTFVCSYDELESYLHPEAIIPDLSKLLCRIMAYTPQQYSVALDIPENQTFKGSRLVVNILNSGVSLKDLEVHITHDIGLNIHVESKGKIGTVFQLELPVDIQEVNSGSDGVKLVLNENEISFPPFFSQLSDHLQAHISNVQKLEESALKRNQKEGVFLKKVNAVIMANLENESFNIVALSNYMALSRSQLYRRLKPLISHSPSNYIRFIRLQKAKELLEEGDLTIGEIAFRTGFINQSHFSRIFKKEFGFNPSHVKYRSINQQ